MGDWLPFVGTLAAALTAGVVALIVDSRRRDDAGRVRHDEARMSAYSNYLAAIDAEIYDAYISYFSGKPTPLPEGLYQSAARCHLLMDDKLLQASRDVLNALSTFRQLSPARTGDQTMTAGAVKSAALSGRADVEKMSGELLNLMQSQLGVRHSR